MGAPKWFTANQDAVMAELDKQSAQADEIAALTAALDASMQALTPIASWMLKAEMSGIGPDHTDKDRLLDTAITLARAALDAAKKARG